MEYQLVIVGSGPAGLTAGIYASRAKIKTLIIDGPQPGGQLMTTTKVENWPSQISVDGPELMINMRMHAEKCGAQFLSETITSVDFKQRPFTLTTDQNKKITAQSVIIATGASSKLLGCKGEKEYWAKGVSTCSTCDAPFFQGKEVVIVGGGDTAMTEAEHLTHFASKVTVVHILDALTGKDPIKDKVLAHSKVSFIYSSTVTEINGDGNRVTEVVVRNQQTQAISTLKADGVFIAIGFNPNTGVFKGQVDLDQYGYIRMTNTTHTSVEGVFAAGDCEDFRYRQAITSAGVGCMAALDAQKYLSRV